MKQVLNLMLAMAFGVAPALLADENITIPKSRLEELQRKEAELEKLKGDYKNSKDENATLKKQQEETVKHNVATPVPPAAAGPELKSLPPLNESEIVDSVDLAIHFRADPALAAQRYDKQSFKVKGEIAGFQVPHFLSYYKIRLKTEGREMSVICNLARPENYRAVFTAKNGTELVGLLPHDTRELIAKVGDTVIISGRCKGMSDGEVEMSRCELKSRQ